MIRDEKAIRAAELVRQYCRERSCYACIFRTVSGVCLIGDTRVPENWQLNGLKPPDGVEIATMPEELQDIYGRRQ